MSVIDEVCGVSGHNIISMIAADVIDPVFKLVVHKYELRCTQCGKTKDETDKYRISGRGKSRQRKAKENGNNHSAKAGSSEAANEAPVPQPVLSSQPSVLEPKMQQNSEQS